MFCFLLIFSKNFCYKQKPYFKFQSSSSVDPHYPSFIPNVVAYEQTKTTDDGLLFSAKKQHNSCRSSLERTRSLRVQIWFLYWLDILSWMFQRHLKISVCETELMIFSENRSSFSVFYLSQWHEHPPSSTAQKPRRHTLHFSLTLLFNPSLDSADFASVISHICQFISISAASTLVPDAIVSCLDSWFFTGLWVISQCAHYSRVTYSKYKSNQIPSLHKTL